MKNYYITLEVHDEGEWPRIAPENLMQHVDVRLPSGLILAAAKASELEPTTNPIPETDLIAIAERGVIEAALKWHAEGLSPSIDAEENLHKAVTLLECRAAMAATTHLDDERGQQ
jgi:hypothetical protein